MTNEKVLSSFAREGTRGEKGARTTAGPARRGPNCSFDTVATPLECGSRLGDPAALGLVGEPSGLPWFLQRWFNGSASPPRRAPTLCREGKALPYAKKAVATSPDTIGSYGTPRLYFAERGAVACPGRLRPKGYGRRGVPWAAAESIRAQHAVPLARWYSRNVKPGTFGAFVR